MAAHAGKGHILPHYYFDIHDGENNNRDREGMELPDREAVRREAISVLPDVAREELPDGNHRDFTCIVRDDRGMVIFVADLALHARWTDEQGGAGK